MICPLASPPVPEPDQKTNPRMKTTITANSVHFNWWKLSRIVLSIENPPRQRFALRVSERATIHKFLRRGPVGWTGDGRTAELRGKCAISEEDKSRSFGSLCANGSPASRQ